MLISRDGSGIPIPRPFLRVILKLKGDYDTFVTNDTAKESLLYDVSQELNLPRHLLTLERSEAGSILTLTLYLNLTLIGRSEARSILTLTLTLTLTLIERSEAGSIIAEIMIANPRDGTLVADLEKATRDFGGKEFGGYACAQVSVLAISLAEEEEATIKLNEIKAAGATNSSSATGLVAWMEAALEKKKVADAESFLQVAIEMFNVADLNQSGTLDRLELGLALQQVYRKQRVSRKQEVMQYAKPNPNPNTHPKPSCNGRLFSKKSIEPC